MLYSPIGRVWHCARVFCETLSIFIRGITPPASSEGFVCLLRGLCASSEGFCASSEGFVGRFSPLGVPPMVLSVFLSDRFSCRCSSDGSPSSLSLTDLSRCWVGSLRLGSSLSLRRVLLRRRDLRESLSSGSRTLRTRCVERQER